MDENGECFAPLSLCILVRECPRFQSISGVRHEIQDAEVVVITLLVPPIKVPLRGKVGVSAAVLFSVLHFESLRPFQGLGQNGAKHSPFSSSLGCPSGGKRVSAAIEFLAIHFQSVSPFQE